MSTTTVGPSKSTLNDAQRDWIKRMAAALNIQVEPVMSMGVDIPLAGVFPEILWDQRKADVSAAESMLKELEDTQLPIVPQLRKEFDLVRSSEKQNKCSEALKAFDAIEPKIKHEYERLWTSRLGGVRNLGSEKYATGLEIGKIEGDKGGPGAGKAAGEANSFAAAKPVAAAKAGTADAKPAPPAPASAAAKPAQAAAAADCSQYKKQVLKVGSKGPAVECVQKILGGELAVDGKFGPATQKAVKAFQKSKGLKDDGIVGEKTWTALGGGAAAGGAGTATSGKVGAAGPPDAAKLLEPVSDTLQVRVNDYVRLQGGSKRQATLQFKLLDVFVADSYFPGRAGHIELDFGNLFDHLSNEPFTQIEDVWIELDPISESFGPPMNIFAIDNVSINHVAVLTGDYNRDGAVNAADYVVWRNNNGTQAGYNKWRANFSGTLIVDP